MNYNPVYPVFVKYNVSQDIWNLHDIYVWHFLLKSFGTKKTFRYLQYRLEHNQSMYPIISFLCIVFLISWLVTFSLRFSSFRRQFAHQNTVTLLKHFILNLHPTLRFVIERRLRLIRTRRERQVTRVITSQPTAAGGAGLSNGAPLDRGQSNGTPLNRAPLNEVGSRENHRDVSAKRLRDNLKRQHTQMTNANRTLSSDRNSQNGENTDDSDSGNSPT